MKQPCSASLAAVTASTPRRVNGGGNAERCAHSGLLAPTALSSLPSMA